MVGERTAQGLSAEQRESAQVDLGFLPQPGVTLEDLRQVFPGY